MLTLPAFVFVIFFNSAPQGADRDLMGFTLPFCGQGSGSDRRIKSAKERIKISVVKPFTDPRGGIRFLVHCQEPPDLLLNRRLRRTLAATAFIDSPTNKANPMTATEPQASLPQAPLKVY